MWTRPKRSSLVCVLVIGVCGCGRGSQPADPGPRQSFVYEARTGIAKWHENRGCLAVFDSSITPRTRVALVDQPASTEPPSVKEARVVERVAQACEVGLSFANSRGVLPSFYEVATADGTTPPAGPVFAILDPLHPFVVREGRVEADLDGDGADESFWVCNSTENLHFMIWTGQPARGRPRWHGSYYVGYDMDPSCTEQDVAGMVLLEKRGAGEQVDRRMFEVVQHDAAPEVYSVHLELADDLPGGADRSSRISAYQLGNALYLRVIPQTHAYVPRGAFAYAFQLSRDPTGATAIPATDQPAHGPSDDLLRAVDFRNSDNTGPNAVGAKNRNAAGEFRRITYATFVVEIRVLSFELVGLGSSQIPAFSKLSCLVTIRRTDGHD